LTEHREGENTVNAITPSKHANGGGIVGGRVNEIADADYTVQAEDTVVLCSFSQQRTITLPDHAELNPPSGDPPVRILYLMNVGTAGRMALTGKVDNSNISDDTTLGDYVVLASSQATWYIINRAYNGTF
jgi:hypothetical protein